MDRLAIFIFGTFLMTVFLFHPGAANAYDTGCRCGQHVTLEGTVIGTEFTAGGHYNILTDLTCDKYHMNGVNINGQGKPPSSCGKDSHFTVSGTVNCDKVYNISIIPSKLSCTDAEAEEEKNN